MRKTLAAVPVLLLLLCASLRASPTPKDIPPALLQVKDRIASIFQGIDTAMAVAAQDAAAVWPDTNKVRWKLQRLFEANTYAVDCAFVDATGKMAVVTPRQYAKFEGRNMRYQKEAEALWAKKKPLFSGLFHAVEGFDAVDFECPVYAGRKNLLGSIRMIMKPDAFLSRVIAPFAQGGVEFWVMQKDGTVLYDPVLGGAGKNVFKDPLYKPYRLFVGFAKKAASQERGSGSYEFLNKKEGQLVKKVGAWTTVGRNGLQWRIVASKPQ